MKTYSLKNAKGISVLFLIITILLMVTIGYVFSYLIPTKQKSISMAKYSPQAFYLAQSGVEFAIRYADANNWETPNQLDNRIDNLVRTLGPGTFTIDYDCSSNTLTSIGAIPGTPPNVSERIISVSSFTSFVTNPMGLILDLMSPAQCWISGTQRARFYIRNATETNITLTAFSASWSGPGNRRLTSIWMDGIQKYSGSYSSDNNLSPPQAFNQGGNSQEIASDVAIPVEIYWNNNITGNIIIRFGSRAGGNWDYYYTFHLNPCGTGMGSCS